MNIQIQYKDEYEQSITRLNEAISSLNSYTDSLTKKDGEIHYSDSEENMLLEEEENAMKAYHEASRKFFGDE